MRRLDEPCHNVGDDQVPDDVMHLTNIGTFNGLCRVIAALAENGLLAPHQLYNIEDCMTAPLDDPEWRDNRAMVSTRDILVGVLARAMKDSRKGPWRVDC
jgi:hypothetical protein